VYSGIKEREKEREKREGRETRREGGERERERLTRYLLSPVYSYNNKTTPKIMSLIHW
jgi:hypothetical protein